MSHQHQPGGKVKPHRSQHMAHTAQCRCRRHPCQALRTMRHPRHSMKMYGSQYMAFLKRTCRSSSRSLRSVAISCSGARLARHRPTSSTCSSRTSTRRSARCCATASSSPRRSSSASSRWTRGTGPPSRATTRCRASRSTGRAQRPSAPTASSRRQPRRRSRSPRAACCPSCRATSLACRAPPGLCSSATHSWQVPAGEVGGCLGSRGWRWRRGLVIL
mmetsp:Transcript_22170/g.56331  ORF Transcript_22170/g.56331 Transcript_22170/m.56331 type:complete len:218 (+) Transcript_22170:287-940(+)